MPENRFLRIVVVVLLLLNSGTLGFLLLQHPAGYNGPYRDPPDGGGPAGFLRRELSLTDAQENRYKELRHAHRSRVDDLRAQIRDQEKRLYGLMKNSDTVALRTTAGAIMDSIGMEQRLVTAVTFEHFREVRALCTPAQQARFDEVILQALSQLH